MKCPRCHHNMIRKVNGDSWYFECPNCLRTIARPDVKENPDPIYVKNAEVVNTDETSQAE